MTSDKIQWYEKDKVMNKNLFIQAEQLAREISQDLVVSKREPMSSTQMRRYYSEVKQWDYQVKSWRHLPPETQEEKFAELLPLIKMFRAKIAYKEKATSGKLSKHFSQFMSDCILSVDNLQDFKAFALYFEALVGFYMGLVKK